MRLGNYSICYILFRWWKHALFDRVLGTQCRHAAARCEDLWYLAHGTSLIRIA
jgi:hypothetical protein